jgi:hypothetical protein
MKCNLCNYSNSPDNLNQLVAHLELCEHPLRLEAKVVWRNSEITAILGEPEKDEHVFEVDLFHREPAPIPPEAVPIPQVEVTVKEVSSRTVNDQG